MNINSVLLRAILITGIVTFAGSCSNAAKTTAPKSTSITPTKETFSYFGAYQQLPKWSDWCPINENPTACKSALRKAVKTQTKHSRKTVRSHGWQLWAGISSPLKGSGYDVDTNTSTLFGTTGCWNKNKHDKPACSGAFPLWLSWPNTGVPFQTKSGLSEIADNTEASVQKRTGLIDINLTFSAAELEAKSHTTSSVPNPTRRQTVNTLGPIPTYKVPAIAIAKQCNLKRHKVNTLLAKAYGNHSSAAKYAAWEKINTACIAKGHPNLICPNRANPDASGICDGSAFVNQGDVMIATESLTSQAWKAVQKNKLYGGSSTLKDLYAKNDKEVAANKVASWFDSWFISTKHMFWPVKGCKPKANHGERGCRVRYGALPPWIPKNFKDKHYSTNANYLGYERWGEVVAIDTCGANCPPASSATLALAHVESASAITTPSPSVYQVDDFMHLQISEETLENAFTATDRALLDQATLWAYGDQSNGFEAGDFLVVVAMHINTKEIETWAFQSVWWSPMNDTLKDCPLKSYNHCYGQANAYRATQNHHSGLNSSKVKKLDAKVGTTWRDNYLLTDSYGINYEIDGSPVVASNYFEDKAPKWAVKRPGGKAIDLLPVSMNPYIEPVIHPLGTNCQNCHRRAGAVSQAPKTGEYAAGVGRANYQNAQCPNLLGDYGMPGKDSCMTNPWAWNQNAQWDKKADNTCQPKDGTLCKKNQAYPIVNTDLTWFVADGHVQKAN